MYLLTGRLLLQQVCRRWTGRGLQSGALRTGELRSIRLSSHMPSTQDPYRQQEHGDNTDANIFGHLQLLKGLSHQFEFG